MRINNPKALVTFNNADAYDEKAYSLATIGQLENAIDALNKKFVDLLVGTDPEHRNGLTGFSNKTGYAYLDVNGKLPPSLMPSLAVTEVFTVGFNTIKSYSDDPTAPIPADDVSNLMKQWMEDNPKDIDGNDVVLQKGDIVVLIPEKNAETNETEIDPVFCGAYITTEVPVDGDQTKTWVFSRISYEASKIVTVNSQAPTTAGVLNLTPYDIFRFENGKNDTEAQNLVNTLWRFGTKFDDGQLVDRFTFNDETYAKSAELDKEIQTRTAQIDYLSGLVSGNIEEIGQRSATAYTEDGKIFPQLNGLRNLVDNHATVLKTIKTDTNAYLTTVEAQLKNLITNNLNGRVIELKEENITFTDHTETPAAEIILSDYEGEDIVLAKKGTITWTCTYQPSQNAADERVIAIYDENGNQFFADMKRDVFEGHATNTIISLTMDRLFKRNTQTGAETEVNSISGKTFKILVASSMNIEISPVEVSVFEVSSQHLVKDSQNPITGE